ncbi:MAG: gliding motility-associated ABC transporter ATP-binding subunit GldA [Bacteroidia bacterium]|nr:MAG: gliding motility-associated ABC transporter ATP-binding subunit GldA [Bacteroidia bacterium]
MSIIAKNVTKIYGQQKALDKLSFEISKGDIVGFIGPNGAGKSTMMKIITGFIPQTSGEVLVNGLNTLTNSLEIRKNIGYLPEHNPLYLDMYVKEYLLFNARIYKIRKKTNERIKEMIAQTGLELEQHKKIGALSKGYRQRVGLAQALLHDPKVLILDEPTSGLDPNQIVEIRNLISKVGKEKTVMLSTHIMQEVEAICDKVIILNHGKIVMNKQAKAIREKIKDKQIIIAEFNKKIEQKWLEKINGVSKVLEVSDNKWLIESDSETDIRETMFNFAVEQKLILLSLQKQEKTLEQIFRELTLNDKNN